MSLIKWFFFVFCFLIFGLKVKLAVDAQYLFSSSDNADGGTNVYVPKGLLVVCSRPLFVTMRQTLCGLLVQSSRAPEALFKYKVTTLCDEFMNVALI
jgi:hypothetical protein